MMHTKLIIRIRQCQLHLQLGVVAREQSFDLDLARNFNRLNSLITILIIDDALSLLDEVQLAVFDKVFEADQRVCWTCGGMMRCIGDLS